MKKDAYDIIADIIFFKTEDGGRKSSTPDDKYRCIFIFKDNNYDCQLNLETVGSITPGDTVSAPIVFFKSSLIKNKLSVGDKFLLRERNIIASGTVNEIHN